MTIMQVYACSWVTPEGPAYIEERDGNLWPASLDYLTDKEVEAVGLPEGKGIEIAFDLSSGLKMALWIVEEEPKLKEDVVVYLLNVQETEISEDKEYEEKGYLAKPVAIVEKYVLDRGEAAHLIGMGEEKAREAIRRFAVPTV